LQPRQVDRADDDQSPQRERAKRHLVEQRTAEMAANSTSSTAPMTATIDTLEYRERLNALQGDRART
jgi:hypothetical protein